MAAPKADNLEKRIEAKGRVLKFGEVTVDLKSAVPITIGDGEILEGLGLKLAREAEANLTESVGNMRKYLSHFVRKAKPDVTDEQIGSIPAWQMIASIRYIQFSSAEPPDPN